MRRDRCGSGRCRGQSRTGAYGVTAQRSTHGKKGLYIGKLKGSGGISTGYSMKNHVQHPFMTDRAPKQYEGLDYEKSKSKGLL